MKPIGLTRRTLLAAGCLSVAAHAGLIGGWMWWESGSAGGGAARQTTSVSREISVQILQPSHTTTGSSKTSSASQANAGSGAVARIPAHPKAANPEGAVSAARVLADPATGLIFSVYFKAVKAKLVQQAARETAAVPIRSLPVHFVLSRDGAVDRVSTTSGAPRAARLLAEHIVSAAAPFPLFPASIPHDRISFDVLFRFDENVLG